jgi:hypothetical protein
MSTCLLHNLPLCPDIAGSIDLLRNLSFSSIQQVSGSDKPLFCLRVVTLQVLE